MASSAQHDASEIAATPEHVTDTAKAPGSENTAFTTFATSNQGVAATTWPAFADYRDPTTVQPSHFEDMDVVTTTPVNGSTDNTSLMGASDPAVTNTAPDATKNASMAPTTSNQKVVAAGWPAFSDDRNSPTSLQSPCYTVDDSNESARRTSHLDRFVARITQARRNGSNNLSIRNVDDLVSQMSAAARQDRVEADRRILDLETMNEDLQHDLSKSVTPPKAVIKALNAKIVTLTNTTEVGKALHRWRSARGTLERKIGELERENERLQDDIRRLKGGNLLVDKTQLEEKVRRLQQKNETLTNTTKAGKEVHKLSSLNGMLHGDVSRLETKLDQFQQEYTGLMASMTRAAEEIVKLRDTNEELSHQNELLQREVSRLRTGSGCPATTTIDESLHPADKVEREVRRLRAVGGALGGHRVPSGPHMNGSGATRDGRQASSEARVVTCDAYRPDYPTPAHKTAVMVPSGPRQRLYSGVPAGPKCAPPAQPSLGAAFTAATRPQPLVAPGHRIDPRLSSASLKRAPSEMFQAADAKRMRPDGPQVGVSAGLGLGCGLGGGSRLHGAGLPASGNVFNANSFGISVQGNEQHHPSTTEPPRRQASSENSADAVDKLILSVKAKTHKLTDDESRRLWPPGILKYENDA